MQGLEVAVPRGWFLPITPGTRFVTVGGAVANDVHGKNHHRAGTFGHHVRRFELLRSTGERLLCAQDENPQWFAATLGGLGLTGLITWTQIQLRTIPNPWIRAETIRFAHVDEFFALTAESDASYEYTVSWIDCAARGRRPGRGLFLCGNHAQADATLPPRIKPRQQRVAPMSPLCLVNRWSLRAFNCAYYHRQPRCRHRLVHYEPFFYPLDQILEWNRLYGPRGFFQYQCTLPLADARWTLGTLLDTIAASGLGSFLTTLKTFGDTPSQGMLCFPSAGVTLALDFPNRGARLQRLFTRLDSIVSEARGRIYLAKDARLPAKRFRTMYPRWSEFSAYIDPRFSSSLWRRVASTA